MSSSLYTRLVATVLFPLHEWLKKHHTVKEFKRLEQSQWLSTQEIAAIQTERLQAFIKKIYQHVPYYRALFDRLALTPADIQTPADLAKLPFLTKDVIRDHFASFTADNAGPLKRFNTGGSSGQPLVFMLGNERVSHDVAEKWRATRWWNVDIGDKEIVAWGSPIELTKQDKIKVWRDKLFRSTLIPAFDLTEAKLLAFIEQIRDTKPTMLFGYPSVFHLIAQSAEKHQMNLRELGIKVVFVTSERLYPYQRELIEQVFNAPVANGYGGRDAGFIAHQCPAGGMHISAEDIVVEIVDREGKPLEKGVQGEIVVTHLATSEFPFVRYRTGDIAALSTQSCSCGRGLPLLEQLEGRSTDFVVASNGTMMHGLALIYILRDIPAIDGFKITQHSLQHTQVQIVTAKHKLPDETEQLITQQFKQRLGQDVQIAIEYVAEIAPEKSGKYRYVISKVTAA
jgi:phenylacetate-CoA ligase